MAIRDVSQRFGCLMLVILYMLFMGSLEQTKINWDVAAATTGWSMAIVHLSAVVFAVLASLILLVDLYRVVTGQIRHEDLVMVQESEEAVQLKEILAHPPKAGSPQ